MTLQLELVLRKYDLELTPDEQVTIWDEVAFYHESNQSYFDQDEDEALGSPQKDERLIYEIEDLVDSCITKESKTRTITFSEDQLWIIYHALNEKRELYSSTYDRYQDENDLKIVDKEGNLRGIYLKIFKKIKEELNGQH